jgi:predicted metal-dependent phosphoesterase TrpH
MFKVDLHTHSVASPDGALTAAQYRRALEQGRLDCIAVTDHNTITFALGLQQELGSDKIIVGEEITTTQGEIIGLYLKHVVPAGLTAMETVKAIHDQGGLVYIPHPFETVRQGISMDTLEEICAFVDIIEIRNGRAVFQNFAATASAWALAHDIPGGASSDAHGQAGWCRTYSMLPKMPTRRTMLNLLAHASHVAAFPGLRGMLYPKFNRIRKRNHPQPHAD